MEKRKPFWARLEEKVKKEIKNPRRRAIELEKIRQHELRYKEINKKVEEIRRRINPEEQRNYTRFLEENGISEDQILQPVSPYIASKIREWLPQFEPILKKDRQQLLLQLKQQLFFSRFYQPEPLFVEPKDRIESSTWTTLRVYTGKPYTKEQMWNTIVALLLPQIEQEIQKYASHSNKKLFIKEDSTFWDFKQRAYEKVYAFVKKKSSNAQRGQLMDTIGKIIHDLAVDFIRKEIRMKKREVPIDSLTPQYERSRELEEKISEKIDIKNRVKSILENTKLKEKDRKLLQYELDDYSIKEIAKKEGKSENAVRARLHRLHRKVQELKRKA